MRKLQKVKITFEHADGAQETVKLSCPLAIATIDRTLEGGWPWISAIIDGKRIKGHLGNVSNVYLSTNNEQITI